MSANLNKSLDDIIGAKPRAERTRKRGAKKTTAGAGGITKKAAPAKKDVSKLKEGDKKKRAPKNKVSEDDPFYQATKITISNMPLDITDAKLKAYLAKELGGVRACEGLYGKNGKPTGKFTVEFSGEGKALAAFKKLNNMPMDNGARILSVEIHSDPTKKSLASRFGGKVEAPKPKAAAPKAKAQKKRAPKAERPKRPAKKTVEDLDAEMDDYHNQNDAITV